MTTVWTIGYESLWPDALVAELSAAGVQRVLDVRYRPQSRRPGMSKTKLGLKLAEHGISYEHRRELGTPVDIRGLFRSGHLEEARAAYREQRSRTLPSRSTRWPPSCRGCGRRSCASRRTRPAAIAASSRSCWPSACPDSWWKTCRRLTPSRMARVGAPRSAETADPWSQDPSSSLVRAGVAVRAGPRPGRDHGRGGARRAGSTSSSPTTATARARSTRRSTSRRGRTCRSRTPPGRRRGNECVTVGGDGRARWWRAQGTFDAVVVYGNGGNDTITLGLTDKTGVEPALPAIHGEACGDAGNDTLKAPPDFRDIAQPETYMEGGDRQRHDGERQRHRRAARRRRQRHDAVVRGRGRRARRGRRRLASAPARRSPTPTPPTSSTAAPASTRIPAVDDDYSRGIDDDVSVTNDGVANDGEAGEGDNVISVEKLRVDGRPRDGGRHRPAPTTSSSTRLPARSAASAATTSSSPTTATTRSRAATATTSSRAASATTCSTAAPASTSSTATASRRNVSRSATTRSAPATATPSRSAAASAPTTAQVDASDVVTPAASRSTARWPIRSCTRPAKPAQAEAAHQAVGQGGSPRRGWCCGSPARRRAP